ncbi:choline-phosphate cytidylyltransferase [Naganishia albida]|nr:choline-phosphate cytidylyltransferase [Naganishia albida]
MSAPQSAAPTAASVPKRRKQHTHHRPGGQLSSNSSRDASEEDNDEEQTDDAASTVYIQSPHTAASNADPTSPLHHSHKSTPHAPHQRLVELSHGRNVTAGGISGESDADTYGSEAVDSPTYDGDIESSSVHGALAHAQEASHESQPPTSPNVPLSAASDPENDVHPVPRDVISHPLPSSRLTDHSAPPSASISSLRLSSDAGPPKMTEPPHLLPEEDIRAFVRRAVEGRGQEDGVVRNWKTNEPPRDRPVRIYADGVYDLFHFGHALQLRQAKLSFTNVHLLVGVCSDDLCAEHKSAPAMTHAERCEGVKHCRWADEVVPDAPWQIDQEFIDRYRIDYVAHDEMVYPTKGVVDVYDFVKKQGRFLPTRRTPCISTSDLLERIVRGYRDGFFDSKLEKNGHPELMASDVDWDSSASVERKEARRRTSKGHAKQEGGVKGLVQGVKDLVA